MIAKRIDEFLSDCVSALYTTQSSSFKCERGRTKSPVSQGNFTPVSVQPPQSQNITRTNHSQRKLIFCTLKTASNENGNDYTAEIISSISDPVNIKIG